MTSVTEVTCVATKILNQRVGILTHFPFDTGDTLDRRLPDENAPFTKLIRALGSTHS